MFTLLFNYKAKHSSIETGGVGIGKVYWLDYNIKITEPLHNKGIFFTLLPSHGLRHDLVPNCMHCYVKMGLFSRLAGAQIFQNPITYY